MRVNPGHYAEVGEKGLGLLATQEGMLEPSVRTDQRNK
jgi:hypothetical protein